MDNGITPENIKTNITRLMNITGTRCWAEREKLERMVNWLADAAAEYACPANGHVTCDKFIRTFANLFHCAESSDKEYRKKCWLDAAGRVMDARREAAEGVVGE